MIARLFLLGVRFPVAVSMALLVVTALALAGLPRLQIDTSFDSLIPNDDPARLVHQRILREFGSDNRTILYVADDDLWTPAKLERLDLLQQALARLPDVREVDSLFDLRVIQGQGGRVTSRPVIESLPRTLDEALQARERALENPLYLGNFFSEDATATAIIISVLDTDQRSDFSRQVYAAIEEVLAEYQGDFESLFQVGPPRVDHELRTALTSDFVLLGPLAAAVLIGAILFFMRSVLAALIPLLTSTITVIWTFGLLGWTGVPLNILSAMIPALIIVIGSTEDTHIMAAFARSLTGDDEAARRTAIAYVARHVGLPLLLTVLTTGLGFAANLFSNIDLIRDFAVASTFAMFANGVVTMLLAPMLLQQFGRRSAGAGSEPLLRDGLPERIVRAFRVPQDRFPLRTLLVTGLLCAFFVYEASSLYVSNDPLSYFPEDRPLIQQTRQINEELAGVKVFFVTLEARERGAFLEPRNLQRLAEIQDFLSRQGVFDTSISLADHLKYVNREFRGDFPGRASGLSSGLELPGSRELVAQYLLFFHRGDLDSYVSRDYAHANIVVRHGIDDSHTLNRYIAELEGVVAQIAGPGMTAAVVGENLMVNRAAESLMRGQVQALLLLLGLIFLLMSAMFTSLKGGAIAMIPAVIPIAIMFGIMGLLDIPLNPGTAMVAVIAIGIAIDGTIHLLAHYNELCRRTSDYVGAVHQAVREEATPLIVSSLALALGFGVLIFSNFTVVAQFGALAAATMLISIVANLLVTPIIMTRIRLVGLYQILSVSVDKAVLERSPLFRDMSDYQRRKAILISELHDFDAGERLVEQGTVGRSMFLILDGRAEVVRRDGSESRQVAVLEPGQVFGEIGYIRAIERTADVQALTPVSALRFDYERLEKDLKFFPNIVAKLNFNISAILGERVADLLVGGAAAAESSPRNDLDDPDDGSKSADPVASSS